MQQLKLAVWMILGWNRDTTIENSSSFYCGRSISCLSKRLSSHTESCYLSQMLQVLQILAYRIRYLVAVVCIHELRKK